MRRTELLQGIRKMRFEEVCLGWSESRLIQCVMPEYIIPGLFEVPIKSDRHLFPTERMQT